MSPGTGIEKAIIGICPELKMSSGTRHSEDNTSVSIFNKCSYSTKKLENFRKWQRANFALCQIQVFPIFYRKKYSARNTFVKLIPRGIHFSGKFSEMLKGEIAL